MSCAQCKGIEAEFNDRLARREIRRFRKKGPRKTTRWLIELVRPHAGGGDLLDIGGGIGAIQHELAESGAERITSVDASASYIGVAREEAERRGYVDRTRYHRGDFTELAAGIEPADVVTLDRVICCFDEVEALVRESVKRARRVYGLVYPRYEPWVRVGIRVLNLIQRLRRSDFKVFCHPSDLIERLVGEAGLQPVAVKTTLVWQVVSFERTSVG